MLLSCCQDRPLHILCSRDAAESTSGHPGSRDTPTLCTPWTESRLCTEALAKDVSWLKTLIRSARVLEAADVAAELCKQEGL